MSDSKHIAPELEAWVIGALLDAEGPPLRSNAASLLEAACLGPGDFTCDDMRAYFGAIRNAVDHRTPVSAQTVYGAVRGLAGISVNALEHLRQLQASNSANRDELLAHATRLRELGFMRRLREFHEAQLRAVEEPRAEPAKLAQSVAAFAQSFVASAEPLETGQADVLEVMDDWDAYLQGRRSPIVLTGIEALDEWLGGWVPKLNVIAARPSIGKTAIVAECLVNHLRANSRVGLFGFEDGTKWWVERHLSRQLGIPVGLVANCRLNRHQENLFQVVASELYELARNLVTCKRSGLSPAELIARAKRMIYVDGVQVVYIDHAGRVKHQSSGPRERYDLAVKNTYEALADLAESSKVPIVVLHHLNREAEGTKPSSAHLKECGYIEDLARLLIALWESPKAPHKLLVEVLKATKGRRGYTLALERDAQHALVKSSGGGEWSEPKPIKAPVRGAEAYDD